MKKEIAFKINSQEYSVHLLSIDDSGLVQELYEKCLDFMLLVGGQPAGENSGKEEFQSIPPGRSLDDHFVYGIVNRQNDVVGILEGLRGYPDETSWWIGLLLFLPEVRAQGIGQQVLEGFVEYAQAHDVQAIMLGVVEENKRAYEFWKRMGFELVHKREPRQFGKKTQVVNVMRRTIKNTK